MTAGESGSGPLLCVLVYSPARSGWRAAPRARASERAHVQGCLQVLGGVLLRLGGERQGLLQLRRRAHAEAEHGAEQLGASPADEGVGQEAGEASALLQGVKRDSDHPQDLEETGGGERPRRGSEVMVGRGREPHLQTVIGGGGDSGSLHLDNLLLLYLLHVEVCDERRHRGGGGGGAGRHWGVAGAHVVLWGDREADAQLLQQLPAETILQRLPGRVNQPKGVVSKVKRRPKSLVYPSPRRKGRGKFVL